jgi:hypothetical protein
MEDKDHDLLIEIKTIVNGLVEDVKDLKTNMVGRVENLEINKASCDDIKNINSDIKDLQKWRYVIVGIGLLGTIVISLTTYIYLTEQNKQDVRIENVIKMVSEVK